VAPPLQPTVVRFPPDMHEAVKARAEAEDRTMAQTIRRAVKQYLAAEG
jgi:predicted transcriptional regulator